MLAVAAFLLLASVHCTLMPIYSHRGLLPLLGKCWRVQAVLCAQKWADRMISGNVHFRLLLAEPPDRKLLKSVINKLTEFPGHSGAMRVCKSLPHFSPGRAAANICSVFLSHFEKNTTTLCLRFKISLGVLTC